jgi:hypothetical protein
MRRTLALTCLSFASLGLVWACTSNNPASTGSTSDAGDDSSEAGEDGGGGFDVPIIPGPDAPTQVCKLSDTSDPVALCVEKQALQYQLAGAYSKATGVAPSWDAITGAVTAGAGHSWRDDVGFASSIASYHCSSGVYGDNELTPQLDAVMPDLAHTILAELPQAPSGYDGEDYFRLRNAAAGLYYVNDSTDAVAIAKLADAFGRNLQTTYAQAVTWTPDAGGGGGDAGGAGDGGATQTSTLLGTPDGNGHVIYAPAQVIMGAAALLDMAQRAVADADAGGAANAATWRATALSALDYVWARGRDTSTGLFYQQLVTSSDPGHDKPYQGATLANDALLTDVQAEAVLGLSRAQDQLTALRQSTSDGGVTAAGDAGDASLPPPLTYFIEADQIVQALTSVNLFDGITSPPNPAPPGSFMEAFLPSTPAIVTNKTTLGNAWLLGGFHRAALGAPSKYAYVLGEMRSALLQEAPANSSLYSVVTDPTSGVAIQTDYLRAASKDFHFARLFSADGGAGAQEPNASEYRSDAVAAMIEGFTQLWIGRQNPPQCSP